MTGQDDSNGLAPEQQSFQALMDAGLRAADDENYEQAAESFEQAIEANPDDARARYNLALAEQNLGDLESAVATYRRAIQLDSGLIEAYINLGYLYGKLGLDEEALDVFQHAIELDAGNDELFVALGDAYRELGFLEDAIQAYRQAEILNADNATARENLHDVRERVSMQAQHIARLEAQLDGDPSDPERYAETIGAYLEAQRFQDALALAQRATELFADDPTMFEALALVYEAMGDSEQAITAWQQVIALDPEDLDAWERLGSCLLDQDRMEEAVAAFRRSVELDPENPNARFNLAEALMDAEQYPEAITIYQGLLNATHTDEAMQADVYIGLAEAQNAAGLYEEALATSAKLLEEYPEESMGLYQRATALDALGRFDEAIDNYINSLENDPLNADTYNDLADTYLKVGDIAGAIEMANRSIALASEVDLAYETLAQALRANGQNEAAEAAEQHAQALRDALEDDEGDEEDEDDEDEESEETGT